MFGFAVTFIALVLSSFCLLSIVPGRTWWLRSFDFPKIQLLLMLVGLIVIIAATQELTVLRLAAMIISALAALHCLWHIWPYLPFARQEARTASGMGQQIKLFMANVQMENRNFSGLVDLITAQDPDVFILVETDDDWQRHVSSLKSQYPHQVEHPNPSHSGMLLYSKFPLHNAEVRYLVKDYIPSIRTNIELPNGRQVLFYGVHPRPPRPQNSADGRDQELYIVGKEIAAFQQAEEDIPIIVTGDLNDVGWSSTTAEFQKVSGLQDPRKGRGFYNSYHAKFPLWRWPLDHVFHSDHFGVAGLKRLPKFGSDHYALNIQLELLPD